MVTKLIRWLTGGRPMTLVESAFVDVVSGQTVYHCRDTYGRGWMANGRWSWFRVRWSNRRGR